MENQINVPKPCSQNWNSMLPNKDGRFCNSCSKTVIDFTKMEISEIKNYLIKNSGKEGVCGHFKFDQVQTKESIKYDNLRNRISRIKIKPIKNLALFSVSLLFTLTSCMGKAAIEGEPAVIDNDTISDSEIINKETDTLKPTDSIKREVIQTKEKK
ncbi:hypothetical protein FLA105534_04074 [Flavobacterium bizetiae]|uniref:Uncharacterized protein n=2 Tax=Flavobacterium bizetiae TaxID=2704140 RepID=A0A6J4GWP1_9FLAO|nr:hypothetical protein [Flavobacterium bizetiae]CAA9202407.1 hypothetical protein FLA105534_04074 [Flavobacterium bizetiae]CAD5344764.1 hypothetical protein FLA105535_04772 [Flavobacterium bizetiae]CAD5350729.1 hypothetical protein FLA105534_04724 [Flavobacterium bizetiae]